MPSSLSWEVMMERCCELIASLDRSDHDVMRALCHLGVAVSTLLWWSLRRGAVRVSVAIAGMSRVEAHEAALLRLALRVVRCLSSLPALALASGDVTVTTSRGSPDVERGVLAQRHVRLLSGSAVVSTLQATGLESAAAMQRWQAVIAALSSRADTPSLRAESCSVSSAASALAAS
jgi:hypothetical protein